MSRQTTTRPEDPALELQVCANRDLGLSARRRVVQILAAAGVSVGFSGFTPALAGVEQTSGESGRTAVDGGMDLVIRRQKLNIGGRETTATTINGSVPGPLLRFRDGETVTIRVKNELQETTSIHWHGVLVPTDMDGVPGVSFEGIKPGETFNYRFKLRQSGTYWYHSHSGTQELTGVYGPLIIDPVEPEPFSFDREYVVLLSDWSYENPARIIAKLKKLSSYYNFQQRTASDFFRDAARGGWGKTITDRLQWSGMRMDPTDIADVTGHTYTYLINGLSPDLNWTALFKPGERVRLRFINSAAMTHFDVRIPGLVMNLVQADGQNVKPLEVDEFRIAPAETFDMIVQPLHETYAIFAEAMDRSGYAAATLTSREGTRSSIPSRRKRPVRTMADMGMAGGMKMGGSKAESMPGMKMPAAAPVQAKASSMPGMNMPSAAPPVQPKAPSMPGMVMPGDDKAAVPEKPVMHGPDHHGPGNSMVAMTPMGRLGEPGVGLGEDGRRVLVYSDLSALKSSPAAKSPTREIELHLTGNMERYMWSIDGKAYSPSMAPMPFAYGEPLRVTLVNDTMMDHPMHIHGMWMALDNGASDNPLKHTINVKAGEKLSFIVTPDEPGKFAFHCHLLIHMAMGMFRVVSVSKTPGRVAA